MSRFFPFLVKIYFSTCGQVWHERPGHRFGSFIQRKCHLVSSDGRFLLFTAPGPHHSRHHNRAAGFPAWLLPFENRLLCRQGLPGLLLWRHPRFWWLRRRGRPGSPDMLCSQAVILDPWMFVAIEERRHRRSVFTGGWFEFDFIACCLFSAHCSDVKPRRFNGRTLKSHCKGLTLSSRQLKT